MDVARLKQSSHGRKSAGFTLVELIGVMLIIGILAAVAVPQLFDVRTFDARGFYDQTLAMLRYAQKTAIAQRTNVFVNVSGNAICLTYAVDLSCDSNVKHVVNPADQSQFMKIPPAGVSLTSTVSSFSFSGLGGASQPAVISISYGGTTQAITVEGATGYVH